MASYHTRMTPKDTPQAGDTYHHGDLRAALIEAALAELEETGPEGFSLRKVARRAGVSPAAPARHFKDVTGLLTALAAEGYRRFRATHCAKHPRALPPYPLLAAPQPRRCRPQPRLLHRL